MILKIGSFELTLQRRCERPSWASAKTSPPIEKAKYVVSHACYLYDIVEDDLKTGLRYGSLPDCRKMISRTLHDMGFTENQIHRQLGSQLGTRDTIHAQIASSHLRENPWDKVFSNNLKDMRRKFVEK